MDWMQMLVYFGIGFAVALVFLVLKKRKER